MEDELEDPFEFVMGSGDYTSRVVEEEEPPAGRGGGRTVPLELAMRAVEIFMHLGFKDPEQFAPNPAHVSILTSTGESSVEPKTIMPIDVSCLDRFEAIANKRRWTAFSGKADRVKSSLGHLKESIVQ